MKTFRGILGLGIAAALAATIFLPARTFAQDTTTTTASSSKSEQWIHVRVESKEDRGETVRVNVPVEMAAKVLPAINKDNFHDGKVRIDSNHAKDVDLRAILDAVRTSRDGEYVTVQGNDNAVRVAKSAGYLYIHVTDKSEGKQATAKDGKAGAKAASGHESKVEIKVPMKVVDALFSAGKDELDLVAALKALSAHGDTELVTVKDAENTVRIWVDSKNVAD
jgi:predicted lipoprotein with Yx(FWY)xxD motif